MNDRARLGLFLLLFGIGPGCNQTSEQEPPGVPPDSPEADVFVQVNPDAAGSPFGDLFRSVNVDAGKTMQSAGDYERVKRLSCPDPTDCIPGPIRYWDKVNFGRFALESPLSNSEVLQNFVDREFPVYWSMVGVPAFLQDTCTGCFIQDGEKSYHLLRELNLSASDPKNPLNIDVDCACEDDFWASGAPSNSEVGGVTWLDYIDTTIQELLDIFDSDNAKLQIGLWNEPDQLWWEGNQTDFVSMWCETAKTIREAIGDREDVLVGGPDVSAWTRAIGTAEKPLLQAIQTHCGEEAPYDFLTYHQYSEPGKLLFEDSVESIRAWGSDPSLSIEIGEYASSLGHGAETTSPCDTSAIASVDGEIPAIIGESSSSILCDHRGAVEDIALAAALAEQGHDRLYRFEVWDWGTIDMVNSRMGLLTINNLPKPAATAFWMLSHLQGKRIAVINELGGAYPYHLLASEEEGEIVILVAAQNRTVTDQFIRGLLSQGLRFSEDVAPLLGSCASFQTEDSEALISSLAAAKTTAEDLMVKCPELDASIAEAVQDALAYAAPRVGLVDQPFDLTIEIPNWTAEVTRYRLDAYRNTFAESYRQWPNGEFTNESFDFQDAEQALWDYMTSPLDKLEVEDGQLSLEIRPDSATLLRVVKY